MSSNFINANSVSVQKREEQESKKAKVKADVAIVLPVDVASDARFDLDYNGITKAINDYVERYTIDPRISKVEYELSTPILPDKNATNNLKETLTGEKSKVETPEKVIKVDNDAIKDDKVTLKFELSVEETVFLDETETTKNDQQEDFQPISTSKKAQNLEKSKSATTKTKQQANTNNQPKGDLIIQSAEPKLYIQNISTKQLYWDNAPANISHNNKSNVAVNVGKMKITGDALNSGMTAVKHTGNAMNIYVGSNGHLYTNPHARGNQYYKIVGKLADNKLVKRLGIAGSVLSYGAKAKKAIDDLGAAKSYTEMGEVSGGLVGEISASFVAGTAASYVTTVVLVSIATFFGIAAAPVTIVVIAGCATVAGIAASTYAEPYGKDLGGKAGAEIVEHFTKTEMRP